MIGKIKRVELRQIWKNEATDFTRWLEANLDTLSETLGFDLTLVKREQEVGSFSIDLLATDEYGNKVVIENQLEKTDHSHLGQLITYCSNTDAKACVWVAKEPRQEHINAVNWLNRETNLNFYLVKIEAISIDDSKPAALFQIICEPDEEFRSTSAAASELTERGRFNIEFWTSMNERCKDKLPGFTSRRPLKYNFHSQASGRGGLSFAFLAGTKYYGIEMYIDANDRDLNESLLRQLESHREKIENAFGARLSFDPIPNKRACRIRYIIGRGDVMDLDREKIQSELVDHMVKFEKVLKPLIRELSFGAEEAA